MPYPPVLKGGCLWFTPKLFDGFILTTDRLLAFILKLKGYWKAKQRPTRGTGSEDQCLNCVWPTSEQASGFTVQSNYCVLKRGDLHTVAHFHLFWFSTLPTLLSENKSVSLLSVAFNCRQSTVCLVQTNAAFAGWPAPIQPAYLVTYATMLHSSEPVLPTSG